MISDVTLPFPPLLTSLQCLPCVFQYCHVLRTHWSCLEAEQVGMMKRLPLLWLQPISRCVVARRGGLKVKVVFLPALDMIPSSFAACLLVISMKRQPNRCWKGGGGSFACDLGSESAFVSVLGCRLIQWRPSFGFVLLRFSTLRPNLQRSVTITQE